jgi:hypothetical protein
VDTDDAVVDLALTAEPLPTGADRLIAALGRSRFINATDRLSVGVIACDQLLALVADAALIPLDRFQETL